LRFGFKSPAISANCSKAASKSSVISSAMMCGAGRFALSFDAFVFEPEDVEVDLARFNRSS